MKYSPDRMRKLLKATANTADHEITCEEGADLVTRYVEYRLSGSRVIADELKTLEQHLRVCSECFEVIEAIISSLRAESAR